MFTGLKELPDAQKQKILQESESLVTASVLKDEDEMAEENAKRDFAQEHLVSSLLDGDSDTNMPPETTEIEETKAEEEAQTQARIEDD